MTQGFTKTRGLRLAVTALVVVLGTVIATAGVKMRYQRDLKFDFTSLRTWSWHPNSPGQVKIVVSQDLKSEPIQRQYEPVIMQSVEEHLTKRGYPVSSGAPDFHVIYYLLVTLGSTSQHLGQFLPANAPLHMGPIPPSTTSLDFYPQGAFVVDALSVKTGALVWRGVAEAKVEEGNTEEKRTERLRGIIKDLLSKFPQRK